MYVRLDCPKIPVDELTNKCDSFSANHRPEEVMVLADAICVVSHWEEEDIWPTLVRLHVETKQKRMSLTFAARINIG